MKLIRSTAIFFALTLMCIKSAQSASNLDNLIDSDRSEQESVVTTSPETLALLNALTLEEAHPQSEKVRAAHEMDMPKPVVAPSWFLDEAQDPNLGCGLTKAQAINTFSQALQIAICGDPNVRRLAFNLRQYLFEYRKSQSAWMPDINLIVTTASESNKYDLKQSGTPTETDRTLDRGLELSWLLFDFGKREAAIGQKENQWLSQQYQALSGFQDYIVQFAQTYFQVLARRTILAAAKDNEQIARKTWDITQNKYRSGVGVLGDALQAENVLLSATQYRIQREGDYQQALGQLANALNLPVTRSLQPQDTLTIPADGQMMQLQPLLDEATKHHPMILAAEKNKQAAGEQLNQAQRDFLPSISLQAGVNRNTSSLDQQRYSPVNQTDTMYVGVNISIPIFSGFRRYNQLNEAIAQRDLSEEDYQAMVKHVELNTWNAWQGLNTANRNFKLIAQRLATAHRAYDIARGRYLTGVGTIIELLNTQQQLSTTQMDEANVRMEWYLQRLTLLSSVGRLSLY